MKSNYKPSVYRNVWYSLQKRKWKARIRVTSGTLITYHDEEKTAAKWVDMQLIRDGKEPINLLKRINGED